ncbi:MAG: sporulation initiation factor Spo0A C-terminal domain-containing protein [Lachnospiraceae bacterium]|nr:sporulation initiation factor Spo0A C-terminal domain-containing protein [Lachnospiraceae bacterium]
MKNKVINALIQMGMPADINGFQYIVDAMIFFEDEKGCNIKTTELYKKIAERNNTTAHGVERGIRHAFSIVLTKGDLVIVKKYLTLQNSTNGNLLRVFYLKLLQEG